MYFVTASSPEPRQCPYFGKFSVDSMISNKRYIRSLKQSRSFAYFDRNRYFKDKFRSSQDTAVGLHNRRIKRVEQRTGCDNEGYSSLIVGCNSIDTMEFRIECPPSDFISCKWKFIISFNRTPYRPYINPTISLHSSSYPRLVR